MAIKLSSYQAIKLSSYQAIKLSSYQAIKLSKDDKQSKFIVKLAESKLTQLLTMIIMLITFSNIARGQIPGDTLFVQWPIPDSLLTIKDEAIVKFKPNALFLNQLCYSRPLNSGQDSLINYIMSQQFQIDSLIADPALREAIKSLGGIYLRRITSASPCIDTFSITRLGDTIASEDYLWMVLKFNNDTSLINACVGLTQYFQNTLESVEPNFYIKQDQIAFDCFYLGGGSTCAPLQKSLYPDFTNVERAYDLIGYHRSAIKAAIIDDGIWYPHADLNGHLDTNHIDYDSPVVMGFNYLTHNDKHYYEDSKHGTQIAGIIAAQTNRAWNWPHSGIAGIVGDWWWGDAPPFQGCRLYALKVGNYSNNGILFADAIIGAVRDAASYNPQSGRGFGVDIINSSFGYDDYFEYVPSYGKGIHNAYNYAYENGVSLVCSRGNGGTNAGHYPACFDPSWITSVGALDINHKRADFSSFGLGMDFLAPGTSDLVYTTEEEPHSHWKYVDGGTSFAVPHVTGAIAALRAIYATPFNPFNPFNIKPEPEDYENMLKAAASDLNYGYDQNARLNTMNGYDYPTGWGELKIGRIFEMLDEGYVLQHYQINNLDSMQHDEFREHKEIPYLVVDNEKISRVTPGTYHARQREWFGYMTLENDWYWDENSNLYVWGYGGRGYLGGLGPSLHICVMPCGMKGDYYYLFSSPYTEVTSGTGGNNLVNGIIHNNLYITARTYQYELDSVLNTDKNIFIPMNPPDTIRQDRQIRFRISVFGKRKSMTSVQNDQILDASCIYPNPATNTISFKFKLDAIYSPSVRLYNSLGYIVYEEDYGVLMPDSYNKSINISELPAGFYVLELKFGNSRTRNKVIIVK